LFSSAFKKSPPNFKRKRTQTAWSGAFGLEWEGENFGTEYKKLIG
jgi:hypothetical protein